MTRNMLKLNHFNDNNNPVTKKESSSNRSSLFVGVKPCEEFYLTTVAAAADESVSQAEMLLIFASAVRSKSDRSLCVLKHGKNSKQK